MCMTFPGRVVELGPFDAVVEIEGRRRRASTLLLPDVEVGDWVAVGAGTVIGRLDPSEARHIASLLRQAGALEASETSRQREQGSALGPEGKD